MENNNGKKWSREETILAYDLYSRIPFGKIGKTNPDIIKLAKLLGRTPDAVGFKLSNLAHFDPALQERNVIGMSHTSKLDREIFAEFTNDGLELANEAQRIRAKLTNTEVTALIGAEDLVSIPEGSYREAILKTRVGQYYFRMSVLSAYNNKCCVTGISQKELLIASHIKPWAQSDDKTEKTNPRNGLCLNALHDMAFDKGFITIDKDYRIVVSKKISECKMDTDTRAWFLGYSGKSIHLPNKFLPEKDFLEYHNDVIFLG